MNVNQEFFLYLTFYLFMSYICMYSSKTWYQHVKVAHVWLHYFILSDATRSVDWGCWYFYYYSDTLRLYMLGIFSLFLYFYFFINEWMGNGLCVMTKFFCSCGLWRERSMECCNMNNDRLSWAAFLFLNYCLINPVKNYNIATFEYIIPFHQT